MEEKDDSVNELMSDEGVCRTAPATPGLLISDGGVCRTAPATPGLLMMEDPMLMIV